jgi:hypothetical protein
VLQDGEQPTVAAANGRQMAAIIPTTEQRPVQREMVRLQRSYGFVGP